MTTHQVIVELLSKAKGSGFEETAAEADALNAKVGNASRTVQSRFEAIGSSGKLMGAAVGVGVLAAGYGLAKLASSGVDAFVSLGSAVKSFQRIAGGSAKDTSELVFALKRVGIEPEVAAKAFFQLSKRIGTGQVDLAKYGIEVKKNADGSINMKDAVLKLSDSMSHLDANQKAARVFELFGRQGAALLPLLTKTKGEIKGIFDLAGKDHQILSQKDVDQAKAYQVAQKELNLAMQGFEVQLGGAIVPLLTDLTGVMSKVAGFVSDNADAFGFLAKIIGGPFLVAVGILTAAKIASIFQRAGEAVVGFTSGIATLVGRLGVGAIAMEGFGATADATAAQVSAAGAAASTGWLATAGILGAVLLPLDLIMGGALTDYSDTLSKTAKDAPKWADAQVAASRQATGGLENARKASRGLVDDIGKLKDRQQLLNDSLHNGEFLKYGKNFSDVQDKAAGLGIRISDLTARHRALDGAIKTSSASTKDSGQWHVDASGKIQGHIQSTKDLTAALNAAAAAQDLENNATIASFSSAIAASQAQKTLAEDFAKGADAQTLQSDALNAAGASAQNAADNYESLTGKSATAEQKTGFFKDALIQLQQQFPALAPLIQGYIDRLNNIPANKSTHVQITTDGVNQLDYAIGRVQQMKAYDGSTVDVYVQTHDNSTHGHRSGPGGWTGGPVPGVRDQAVDMTVHGGEYILDATTVDAIKRGGKSRLAGGASSLNSGMARGTNKAGDTYNISVSALVADANAGRRIQQAINAHKRNGGK